MPHRLALVLTVLGAALAVAAPAYAQRPARLRPARCTQRALAAVHPMPRLEYECVGNDDEALESAERDEALDAYLGALETEFADPAWWATPVEQLNTCSVVGAARALTGAERRDRFRSDGEYDVSGDATTRLVVVADPCVHYSATAANGFVLHRAGGRVTATQVLDGYFTRADDAIRMHVALLGRERVLLVETVTFDGTSPPRPFTTWDAYTIDPGTGRAVPRSLFRDRGKPSNAFVDYDDGLMHPRLAGRLRPVELVRGGRLVRRFTQTWAEGGRLRRATYVWNGRYFARQTARRGARASRP